VNTATLSFSRSSGRPRRFAFDTILMLTVAALLLLGLVMMTSASIAIADRQGHEPLHYLDRQLVGVGLGLLCAVIAMVIPTTVWERLSLPLLLLAFAFLIVVLIPGLGHEVNGSRRWLRSPWATP
jgi:cell division protein FtsW